MNNFNYKLTRYSQLFFWAVLFSLIILIMLPTTTLAALPTRTEVAKPVNTDKQTTKSVPLSAGTIQFERPNFNLREGNSLGTQYISVTRTGGTDGAVSADINLTNLTASNADYSLPASNFISTYELQIGMPTRLIVQPDGKILISDRRRRGTLDTESVIRLNADYTIDTSFTPPSTSLGQGYTLKALQSDGKIIIGKDFIERLNSDGIPDQSFSYEYFYDNHVEKPVLPQPDGKILLGVAYQENKVIRVNSNGSIDNSFVTPVANALITSLGLQSDGKILVGGDFTTINGQPYLHLARLNSNGSLDTTFVNPNINNSVSNIVLQNDGKILIGGYFTMVNGQPRRYLTRLNSDGTLDLSFAITITVGSLFTLQNDGKIIAFTTPTRLVRLNPNGAIDPTFNNYNFDFDFPVSVMGLQTNGRILVGGYFYGAMPGYVYGKPLHVVSPKLEAKWANGEGGTKTIAIDTIYDRLNESDETFQLSLANPSGGATLGANSQSVATIIDNSSSIQFERGSYIVSEDNTSASQFISVTRTGANFDTVSVSIVATDVTTSNNDYTSLSGRSGLTSDFNPPNINNTVRNIALQSDGKVIVSGYFTQVNNQLRSKVARLNSDNTFDPTFPDLNIDGYVNEVLVQPDGKIIIGGAFNAVANQARSYLARLNSDGTLDTTFANPNLNGEITRLALQADNKILIVGNFMSVGGQSRSQIARLNSDGTLDTTFSVVGMERTVQAIALQSDGKIIIGGDFAIVASQTYYNLARLNLDGSVDTSFNISGWTNTRVLVIQPDNKILVGGSFFYGVRDTVPLVTGVLRLNSDGSLDSSFLMENGTYMVDTISLQNSGKILFAGYVSNGGGHQLIRLNSNGTLDNSFNRFNLNDSINSIVVQPLTSKILIGGAFVIADNLNRQHLAQVTAGLEVSWDKGESGTKVVRLPIVNDNIYEGTERLVIGFTAILGETVIGTPSTATVDIIDANSAPTSLILSSAYNLANLNQKVVFTATINSVVPGLGIPTGIVTFSEGITNVLGTATLNPSGIATFTISRLSVGNHNIIATYAGNAIFATTNSNRLTQIVIDSANALVVDQALDDGSGTVTGTLSFALATATPSQTIHFALNNRTNTLTFSSPLRLDVPSGVIIDGGNNQVTIDGNGVAGDGLRLSGNNILRNLTIRGFTGREIVLNGTGNQLLSVRIQN